MGTSMCRLCGFNISGARAVFSTYTCHLFPQHELAIIPLIYGVQVQRPVHAPGTMEAPTSTCSRDVPVLSSDGRSSD